MRKLDGMVCLVVVLASAGSAPAASRELRVDDAVAIALERNLDLLSTARDVDAARGERAAAGRLLRDNPSLTTSAGPRDGHGSDGNTVDWGVALEQRVEIAGQRGIRIEAKDAGLRSVEARLAAGRLALVTEVRESFADAIAARDLAAVAADERALAADALGAARERHEAGDVPLLDVNTAEIELGRATREETVAAAGLRRAELRLEALLGLDVGETVTIREDERVQPTACDVLAGGGLESARERRPELVVARESLAAAQAGLRLAERETFPTPSIGVSYNREVEDDIVQATVSVPLPLFDRNQAARSTAQAEIGKARLALKAAELTVERDLELARTRCEAARRSVESFGGRVVEAAQRNLDLAREGYRAGKLNYFELLIIRREMLSARRGVIESRREWSVAAAQMWRATGTIP
jgi:cobalt-zinc-cadmium efflux system outer membrane protein